MVVLKAYTLDVLDIPVRGLSGQWMSARMCEHAAEENDFLCVFLEWLTI